MTRCEVIVYLTIIFILSFRKNVVKTRPIINNYPSINNYDTDIA